MSDLIDFSNATVVQEYPNGVVKKFVSDKGQTFEAFIPNGCTADTPIVMYEHGDGGYGKNWRTYVEKFSQGASDSIIIRADRRDSVDLYNSLVKQYNLDSPCDVNVSFSGGTVYSIKETAQMIKENPNRQPPISVILDGYVPFSHLESEGVVNTLRDSEAVVLAFGRHGGEYYSQNYKLLAKSGVNVVLFTEVSKAVSHDDVNNSYMMDGLYEYSLGIGDLPDKYEIQVYNSATGAFETLPYDSVSNLSKVYEHFGIENYNLPISLKPVNPVLSFLDSLSSKISSLFEEKPVNLKYSSYNGQQLSVKPISVQYAANYLNNTITSDLETQMAAVRKVNAEIAAYAAEDPAVPYSANISGTESVLTEALEACKSSATSVNNIAQAIIRYGNGDFGESTSLVLNSFLSGNNKSIVASTSSNSSGETSSCLHIDKLEEDEVTILSNDTISDDTLLSRILTPKITSSNNNYSSEERRKGKFNFIGVNDNKTVSVLDSNDSVSVPDINSDVITNSILNDTTLNVPTSLTNSGNTKNSSVAVASVTVAAISALGIGKSYYEAYKNSENNKNEYKEKRRPGVEIYRARKNEGADI